jgi:hypothetical protein
MKRSRKALLLVDVFNPLDFENARKLAPDAVRAAIAARTSGSSCCRAPASPRSTGAATRCGAGLLPIERGDGHAVRTTVRSLLRTLNVCVPPACDAEGDELRAGKG